MEREEVAFATSQFNVYCPDAALVIIIIHPHQGQRKLLWQFQFLLSIVCNNVPSIVCIVTVTVLS